ncbi:MAG: methyltransferase domain-containing protein [Bacteroidales bacterium]|nr:methyltransferase domain-containing protein [Bacteroidales bacterium]
MKKIIKFLLKTVPRPLLIRFSFIVRKPLALIYKGTNTECPVCNKQFKKFLPYGYGNANRDNRLCPNCLSLERHRLLWLYLKQTTNFFTAKLSVLHIAPEQTFLKHFKKLNNLNYTTADLYSPIVDIKTDIRNMVFEDNKFDVVICNHVLEHIDEEQKAMKEILRVMKPGAWAILQVPIDYSLEKTFEDANITSREDRQKYFGQYDHVRLYGKDYPGRLRKAGFKVTEDNFVNSFSEEEQEKYRFDKNDIIYLCKKP